MRGIGLVMGNGAPFIGGGGIVGIAGMVGFVVGRDA